MVLLLKLSRQAGRFIKKLPPKQYKQAVSCVLALLNNSEPHDSSALKGGKYKNRRADIGEYRVVYRVESESLFVLVIGKRNDGEVYKFVDRLH